MNGGVRTLGLLIHNQALLPTELFSPYLRSLAELNHVLRIFSPTHTPRLPKLQCCRGTRTRTWASVLHPCWYSREDSNLHQRFRRPPSYPLNDRSISELHCKGKAPFSNYEISARLAEREPGRRGERLSGGSILAEAEPSQRDGLAGAQRKA